MSRPACKQDSAFEEQQLLPGCFGHPGRTEGHSHILGTYQPEMRRTAFDDDASLKPVDIGRGRSCTAEGRANL